MLTPTVPNRLQAEEELNWLLTSGVLGRSSNMARMLSFVCEKHFQGHDDQVTEHSIAIEALGRRDDFDPQNDTIVRVTAHSLRKRLQEIYQTEGANRQVHIQIPLGNYMPAFVHVEADQSTGGHDATALISSESGQPVAGAETDAFKVLQKLRSRWFLAAAFVVAVLILCGFFLYTHRNAAKATEALTGSSPAALPQPKDTIRALLGTGRKTYVDQSGYTWTPGNFCSGGDSVTVARQNIMGTEDPYLYLGGIRGIVRCTFPVRPGVYEVHFHFAETTNLQSATRVVILSVNAGANILFDVVDNAGGDGIATSYVLAGVRPENDGAIHVEFTSEVSLLNAVEVLPADSDNLLPVRITASPYSITDSANKLWLSDRYFRGGRRGQVSDSAKNSIHSIFSHDRIGSFHYDIPVNPMGMYRVTLYFSEPWFGERNGVNGGPGSRVFNISCNGNMILKNFDIIAEGGSNPVTKTFDNIQASTQGKIDLSFLPVVNYPLVNAIEVVAEPSH